MVVWLWLKVVESGAMKEVVPVVIGWMPGWAFVVILVEEGDVEKDVEDEDVDVAPLMPMLLVVADGAAAAAAAAAATSTWLTASLACVPDAVTDVVSTIVTALVLNPTTGAFVDLVSFVTTTTTAVVVIVLSFLTSAMFCFVSGGLLVTPAGAVPVSDCGSSSDKKRLRMLNMVD